MTRESIEHLIQGLHTRYKVKQEFGEGFTLVGTPKIQFRGAKFLIGSN